MQIFIKVFGIYAKLFDYFSSYLPMLPIHIAMNLLYSVSQMTILLSYCVLTQIIKQWYIKRFVKWL